MNFLKKPFAWATIWGTILILFTGFVLLDTFVIPRAYQVAESAPSATSSAPIETDDTGQTQSTSTEADTDSGQTSTADTDTESGNLALSATVTASSYTDNNISIVITQYREYDTDIFVADITISSPEYLQTALASNTYGKNITANTSEIAESCGAIFAVNGDYYGAQTEGYVVRNGVVYRDTMLDENKEDLVIWSDGSLSIITEGSITAQELAEQGAMQVLSFGPGLLENGEVSISEDEQSSKAQTSHPRTGIGQIDDLHYVFVVADGRTDENAGLTLMQLAAFMQEDLGAKTAYNLDGGGSSSMYFNGEIINNPTDGNTKGERSVSDIVCIGY